MLVATKWNNWGVDFTYTDVIDYNDAMQAWIQDIPNPSIQRHFEEVTKKRVDSNSADETVQTVKNLAAEKSEGNTKGAGIWSAG